MKSLGIILAFIISFFTLETGLEGTWHVEAGERSYDITFTADGMYMVDMGADGTVDVEGTYTVEENTLTMKDTSGEMSCRGDEGGSYTFSVEGDKASFSMVSDNCEGRKGLDGQTLTKK